MSRSETIHVLLIDDDEDDFIITQDLLEGITNCRYTLDWEGNYAKAKDKILEDRHDVFLIDYRLGQQDGLTLIADAVKRGIQRPMILLTGKGDKHLDMQALSEGAWDYLIKSELSSDLLERTIRYSISHSAALRQIQEQEQKFRQLFDRSLDAIYVSSTDHLLEDTNPSFCKLFRTSAEENQQKKLSDFFLEKRDFEEFKSTLSEVGQVVDFEVCMKAERNDELVCKITAIERFDHAGKPLGYQGIINDITSKKRAEEELLLAERLSMTGKLARSIAHEVRNPLTNLGLAMDQLEDELPSDNEDVPIFVDIIKRNAKRIDQLISDLLNSSHPRKLNMVAYSLPRLVDEALDLVRDRLVLKGMNLKKSYDSQMPMVFTDTEKLKLAIVNILVNAIEAMDESIGVLTVDVKKDGSSAILQVIDNGKGIPEEDLSLLFDPFYTKKQGGMGLGLTSTQNTIHSHKGHIEVNSTLGEGTTFSIILPIVEGK